MTHKKCADTAIAKKPGKTGRKDLHKAILQAAELAGKEFGEAGLVSYLQRQALAAPSPFLTLLGKLLAEAQENAPPPIRRIELVPVAGAKAKPEIEAAVADAAVEQNEQDA